MAKEAADPPAASSFSSQARPGLPSGNLVVKCARCKEILIAREWEKNLKVCTRCNYHFKLSAYERIELLVDPDSFVETDADIISTDPLKFVARTRDEVQEYAKKLDDDYHLKNVTVLEILRQRIGNKGSRKASCAVHESSMERCSTVGQQKSSVGVSGI